MCLQTKRPLGIAGAALAALSVFVAAAEPDVLVLTRPSAVLSPAVDARGKTIVFAGALRPDGTLALTQDLYTISTSGGAARRLTEIAGKGVAPRGVTGLTLSPDGALAAYVAVGVNPGEEVHTIDPVSGADRTAAVYTEGCIQPLCVGCFASCVHEPHLAAGRSKVLYAVSAQQPFFVASVDGTGKPARLPIYSGSLAPGPQRVTGSDGRFVFASSAPAGPTFAPQAVDIYSAALDGTGLRQVTRLGTNPSLYAQNATVTADGAVIVFETNAADPAGPPQIWAARADGTDLHPVTALADGARAPSISGDGTRVAFLHKGQAWISAIDGSAQSALFTSSLSQVQSVVISEDGSRVVVTLGPANGDSAAIWTVRTDGSGRQAVYAPAAVNSGGVVQLGGIFSPAPGGLFSLYGMNFTADASAAAGGFPLPTGLSGVRVLVNGTPAPLIAVFPWQINAQLAPDVPPGQVTFQVEVTGAAGTPVTAAVPALAPFAFTYQALTPDGSAAYTQVAALHAGTGIPADLVHPASAGDVLELYGSGLGPTDPPVPAGAPAPSSPLARTLIQPRISVNGMPAEVLFAGLTPGYAGVYQVNFVVPAGLKPGLAGVEIAGTQAGIIQGNIGIR